MLAADTILDSISQSIIATDVDGRISYWNRAAEELYGQSASSVIGRPLCEVVPDHVLSEPSPMFDELRAGRSWSGRRNGNNGAPVLLSASPIFAKGGGLTGFAIISTRIDGADYLVVGRPVTQAPDPRAATEAIVTEIRGALT